MAAEHITQTELKDPNCMKAAEAVCHLLHNTAQLGLEQETIRRALDAYTASVAGSQHASYALTELRRG